PHGRGSVIVPTRTRVVRKDAIIDMVRSPDTAVRAVIHRTGDGLAITAATRHRPWDIPRRTGPGPGRRRPPALGPASMGDDGLGRRTTGDCEGTWGGASRIPRGFGHPTPHRGRPPADEAGHVLGRPELRGLLNPTFPDVSP